MKKLILLISLISLISGCSVLMDKMFSGTSPRFTEKELAQKKAVYESTVAQVGKVDTAPTVEAMKEALLLLADHNMDSRHKLKALLAFYRYTDKIDGSAKLDFYQKALGEGLASGDPSKTLAVLQMMQMQAFRQELESKMPQVEEGIEKGINWLIPGAGVGGGIALGLLGYFARLLHRSQPIKI